MRLIWKVSGQKLIDAALCIFRKKVEREKYGSTRLSVNVPTSAPFHNSVAQTSTNGIIGNELAHGVVFPDDSTLESLQSLMRE